MAKLTGAKKTAFLERMARGRRKAARGATTTKKKRNAARPRKAAKPRKTARKKATRKQAKNPKLTGAKKAAFLKRMAQGRKKAARPNGRKQTSSRKNGARRRRNSGAEEAVAMFETFHQMPPNRIIEYEELVNFPGNFAELGRLKELQVFLDKHDPDFPFTKFGACQVVCTPDGGNIYFVGGDQSIDLEAIGITTDKDTVELGPCVYIEYHTIKGFHEFEPTDYQHNFGEEDGIFPRLGYDRLNKRLFLIGGNYQVKRAGIVN